VLALLPKYLRGVRAAVRGFGTKSLQLPCGAALVLNGSQSIAPSDNRPSPSYRRVCRNAAMLAQMTATFQLVRCKQAVSFDFSVASSHDLRRLLASQSALS
jgi:hypothetical protein